MGAGRGFPSRTSARHPATHRRAWAGALLTFLTFSGLQCLSDLIQPNPRHASYVFHHDTDVDSAWVALGDTSRPPFHTRLTTDGGSPVPHDPFFWPAPASVQVHAVDVDSATQKMRVRSQVWDTLFVRPVHPDLQTDTLLIDTVRIRGYVPRLRIETPETTLTSLADSFRLRATALDQQGAVVPGVQLVWTQLTLQNYARLTNPALGTVRADANGVTEFKVTVADSVEAARMGVEARVTVRVAQRAASVALDTHLVRLSAFGQSRTLQVAVKDANGYAIAGSTVAWSTTASSVAQVSASGVVTAVGDGTAYVKALESASGRADSAAITVQRAHIGAISSPTRTGTVGAALAAPLDVQLIGADSQPVRDAGIAVLFRVTGGGGHLTNGTDTLTRPTDAQGQAAATPTLGTTAGVNTFTATGTGLRGSAVTFTVTGEPGAVQTLALDSGQAQTDTVARALGRAFVVVARDQYGNGKPGVTVAFVVTAGGGKLAGQDSIAATTGADGRARATLTLGTVSGANAVEARAAVPQGSPLTFTAMAVHAAARRLVFTVPPSGVQAGSAIAPAIQVTVRDSFGNRATSATPQIGLAIKAGTGATGATLGGTTSVAATGGIATFGTIAIARVGTGYRLVAISDGLTPDTSVAFDVTPGTPHHLVFSVPPSLARAGRAFPAAIGVRVMDSTENVVTGATAAVSLTISTVGLPSGSDRFLGTGTRDVVNGVAVFPDFVVQSPGVGYRLRATASGVSVAGLPALTSDTFSVRGPPTAIAIVSGDLQPGVYGTTLADSLVVRVTDASGDGVPADTVVFKVTLGGGSLEGGDSVIGVTDAAGRAAARLTLGAAQDTNVVTARSVSLEGQSVAFRSIVGLHLDFLTQPSGQTAGVAFSPAVQVAVRDEHGSLAASSTLEVTLTITDGTGAPGAALVGHRTVAAVGGVAVFADLRIAKAGTGYSLTATATGVASATSATFAIAAGAVSRVVVTPAGVTLSGVGTTTTLAAAQGDALGNPVTGSSVSATWTSLNPAVATVDAAGVVTAVAAGQVTIQAASGGLADGYALVTVAVDVTAPNLVVNPASGTTQDLLAVWGTSSTETWAVGYNGTIVRWNGTSWATQASGTTHELRGVWGTSATEVWAVGRAGTVLRWNGTSWAAQSSGTTEYLYGVWGASPTEVWAVGANGTILRWNGMSWAVQESGTTNALRGVWGTSATDVWATSDVGTLLRWDGTSWAVQESGTANALRGGLWGTSPADVWAVSSWGTILHWNGAGWTESATGTTQDLLAVWGTSPTDVWAVGGGGAIVRWDGTNWVAQASGTTWALYGVWGASAASTWAVGTGGKLVRWLAGGSVEATPASATLTSLGAQRQLTAVAKDASANPVSGVTLTWASSDPSVATVSSAGLVTAVANGTANVIVTATGGAADTVPVTVSQVARRVVVAPGGITLSGVGATTTLTAAQADSLGNVIAGSSLTPTWTSLNPAVATVSGSGVVTALGAGQVTIQASVAACPMGTRL